MSITESNTVDFIGTNQATGEIELLISDHLDWNDELCHLELMQDKLNAYLRFIESGEMSTTYPQSVGRAIVIAWVGKFELSDQAIEFLRHATAVMAQAGVSLQFRRLKCD
jgi:hypothetical protein